MRTPRRAHTLSALLILGSSATVSAQPTPAPAASPAQVVAPAVPPSAASAPPAAAAPAAVPEPAPTLPPPAESPRPASADAAATPEPASIAEAGVQRWSGAAYPEPYTRGLKHGSLWLTFHGLQWPQMPVFGAGSRFVIGLSGWGWVDTAYQKFGPWGNVAAVTEQSRIKYWKQQARFVARVTPTYAFESGLFLQGQAELVATADQTISRSDIGGADTDDLWLRIGKWNSWDLQAGRFEGWEIFHLGMGLDLNTFERRGAVGIGEAPYNIQFYGVSDNQYRASGAAGNLAFHYYPLPYLRVEMLGSAGTVSAGGTIGPMYATRPVAILDFGWLKLKAGTEYQKVVGQNVTDRSDVTSKGIGGAVQFIVNPHLELGLNAAQGTVWSIDSTGKVDAKGSLTRTSFGGFANVSNGHPRHTLIFGIGSIFTRNVDQNDAIVPGVVDNFWHYQGFAAAQYVMLNQFYIKLVGGYSRGHWSTFDSRSFDDEMYSVRLRFSFYF